MMQTAIDKLLAYPLVPAVLLLCWLLLELAARRRMRRDRLRRRKAAGR
jgi:hypothetical protein